MTAWRRVPLCTTACTAAALGIGFVLGDNNIGFGQPGLLALAIPAAVLGFLSRRAFLGAVLAPLLGFAGAVGILIRLSGNGEHWLLCAEVLGTLGGLVCVAAGALGGYIGEKSTRVDGDKSPRSSTPES